MQRCVKYLNKNRVSGFRFLSPPTFNTGERKFLSGYETTPLPPKNTMEEEPKADRPTGRKKEYIPSSPPSSLALVENLLPSFSRNTETRGMREMSSSELADEEVFGPFVPRSEILSGPGK